MPHHHYIKFGSGSEVLLCFHGYEQDSSMFDILDENWKNKYTIYAFDLFHHGKSLFPMDRLPHNPLREEEINIYFQNFFKQNEIKLFQIMGYSLGARFAMHLANLFPDKVEGLYLFAPDGFKKLPLQTFIEQNTIGINLFRSFIRKPIFFHASVKLLRKARIISQRLHDFVIRKTSDFNQRKQLYDSWQTYKKFHLPIDKIKLLLDNLDNVRLVFGLFDAVIPTSNLKDYKVKENQLIIVNKGHDLFDAESLKVLQSRLNF